MRKFRSKICSERLFILFGHWKKHFRRFVEILSAGLSKMHPKCRQRFLRKSSFLGKKRNSFHHQLALSKKYAAFCRKNFGWVFKTVSYMSIETLWWVFFRKNSCFFPSFLDLVWKVCGLMSKNFRHARQNCILRVLRNNFKERTFPEKFCFASFQDSEQKRFGLLLEKLRRGCQNSILRAHWNILMEQFLEKKISYFFRDLAIKLWPSVQKVSGELSKPHPACPVESFEEVFLKILNQFRTLRDKFPALHPKNFAEVVKTIPIVHRNFLTKIVLFKRNSLTNFFLKKNFLFFGTFSGNFSIFLSNIFRLSVQNSNLRVTEKVQNKIVYWRKLHPFRIMKEIFPAFCWNPFGGLLKLHPKCRKRFLRKNRFFGKKSFFSINTGHWTFPLSAEK